MALTILVALAMFVVLAFFRASVVSWVLAMIVIVAAVAIQASFSDSVLLVIGVALLLFVVLFSVPPVRRVVVSSVVLKIFRKILPQISATEQEAIDAKVRADRAGIPGSVMISDAFFPFRDAADVGIREGVTAILQAGGSIRDFESIQACNEAWPQVAMMFTGQRSFKH
jgi:hypothetical protein